MKYKIVKKVENGKTVFFVKRSYWIFFVPVEECVFPGLGNSPFFDNFYEARELLDKSVNNYKESKGKKTRVVYEVNV